LVLVGDAAESIASSDVEAVELLRCGDRVGERGQGFWTDGSWVWSDILRDGVERGSVKPDRLFLAHATGNGYQCPPVDTVALHRAVVALIDVS
jgi:hypothetical protein